MRMNEEMKRVSSTSSGDSAELCLSHSTLLCKCLIGTSIKAPGFCPGKPPTVSEPEGARIFKRLWLIQCSPDILVEQSAKL